MGYSELRKRRSRLSEDEIEEFLIKTERTKYKNTQNILFNGSYMYLLKSIWKNRQSFQGSLRTEVSFVTNYQKYVLNE